MYQSFKHCEINSGNNETDIITYTLSNNRKRTTATAKTKLKKSCKTEATEFHPKENVYNWLSGNDIDIWLGNKIHIPDTAFIIRPSISHFIIMCLNKEALHKMRNSRNLLQ